jgi:hypothetical protein
VSGVEGGTVPRSTTAGIALSIVTGLLLLSAWVIGPRFSAAELQNRPPVPVPDLSRSDLLRTDSYQALDAALTDRLPSKPLAVAMVNGGVLVTTQRSASPQVVSLQARGRDGGPLLSYAGEFTEPCEFTAKPDWGDRGAVSLRDAAGEGGTAVVMVVAPNKSTAFPLPDSPANTALQACSAASRTQLQQLAQQEGSVIRLIDAGQVFAWDPVGFTSGDTHWTPRGGMALLQSTVQQLGRGAYDEAGARSALLSRIDPSGAQVPVKLDLYALLGLERRVMLAGPEVRSPVASDPLPADPRVVRYVSSNPVPGMPQRAVILVDSFVTATNLQTALASVFAEAWIVPWDSIAVVAELPPADVVVLETAERLALGRLGAVTADGAFWALRAYIAGN